jgi:methyltransferase (TIGR00027 family)
MEHGQPSRTVLAAATHRAAHQLLEGGRVFSDPLALRILGEDPESIRRKAAEDPFSRWVRLFIAVRTRFAEDALATAVERGVRQLVVLGAGLDTYAYRCPFGERLRIFEVDHPATQAWKRHRLIKASIPIPGWQTFAPIDFERETLSEGLTAVGFDPAQQTFFTWLGVVPYLTKQAIWSTLGFIAALPKGAHVVFDYGDPPDSLPPGSRASHAIRAARVQELGEPWITHFDAEELRAELLAVGFVEIEDLGPPQIAARYFPNHRATVSPEKGGHIVRATAAY